MPRISNTRIAPDNVTVLKQLGLLGDLVGTWKGHGFNLIARPDFHDSTDLYLQLNQTRETLKFEAIGSPIPNRGFGQDDIELFGLTYLQQISDAAKDGALHIEPGIWVTQPNTTFPPESVPAPQQLVARMGTIPHGNSILLRPSRAIRCSLSAASNTIFPYFPRSIALRSQFNRPLQGLSLMPLAHRKS
jgi:hypothetical protein